MPQNPFTTYNSNQRIVAIPPVPTLTTNSQFSAAGTTQFTALTLSATNLTNGLVVAYIHYIYGFPLETAAASSAGLNFQWQFRTAAHANVGAAVQTIFASISAGGGAGGQLSPLTFAPHSPHPASLVIPATATELCLQVSVTLTGLPFAQVHAGWGIDTVNQGQPGDIGGGGATAQSSTNPNTF